MNKTTTKPAPKYKIVPTSKGPAVSYSPEVEGALGIVSLKVLKSLVESLDSADLDYIKLHFIQKVEAAKTIAEHTAIIGDEFAFRNTLRKIKDTDVHEVEVAIAQRDEIDNLEEALTQHDINNLEQYSA